MTSGSSVPESPESQTAARRTFFQRLGLWATGLLGAAAGLVVAVPFVGYLLGVIGKRPVHRVRLGPVSQFPVGETRLVTFDNPIRQPWDGMTAHTGVYVRNVGKDNGPDAEFLIFAVNCAHLGCPVSWFPQSGLFMCPCHGGVYYADGQRASGPPPRGLFKCVWRVQNGELEIDAPHYPTLQDPLRPGDTEEVRT